MGLITDSKIVSMSSKSQIIGSSLTGISSNAGSEYFEVDLTSDMTSLADVTSTVVDFGGSGTVVYDTASNFDSANDANAKTVVMVFISLVLIVRFVQILLAIQVVT